MSATGDDDMLELYRELILDHARSPRNFGRLKEATHTAQGINPLCGDKLQLYLRVDADERLADTGFEGTGCAISIASASLLTETVKNLSVTAADEVFALVNARLLGKAVDAAPPVDFEKLKALDGVRRYPSRVKCATLAWHALHVALSNSRTAATTE